MEFKGTISATTRMSRGTSTEWNATTEVIQGGVLLYETDTNKLKFTNGIDTYENLPYVAIENLSAALKAYLTKADAAGGSAILDGDGLVKIDQLPEGMSFSDAILFVANIAERDALTADQKLALVYVADASADPTASNKGAAYAYVESKSAWEKIFDSSGMDLVFGNQYIHKSTATMDDIREGTTHVHFEPADRAALTALSEEAVVVTGTYTVEPSNTP